MADAVFRFKEFKWNRRGYNELKASDDVAMHTWDRAEAIARAATMASGKDYTSDLITNTNNPRIGSLGVVRPDGYEAYADNAENNTLLKSIDAGRLQ